MIDLGLERIGLLLKNTPLLWRAIHVAGTNGKGSICAYASALLRQRGIRCGRFTSPHIIQRWDCIAIDDIPITETAFREVEASVLDRNVAENIKASEFELLTATAFEIFNKERVEVGVIEVGMGGRLDATNVLQNPLVTVISKIGLDHQAWLGNTIEEIAKQKAGIFKPGVPRVVDPTNPSNVKRALEEVAQEVKAGPLLTADSTNDDFMSSPGWTKAVVGWPAHQKTNAACAYIAVQHTLRTLGHSTAGLQDHLHDLAKKQLPGRLQHVEMTVSKDVPISFLLDGAHNADSALVLGKYVDEHLRPNSSAVPDTSITWVLAMTQGKDAEEILKPLLRKYDNVVTVGFGPVDGMPWIKPTETKLLLQKAFDINSGLSNGEIAGDISSALIQANDIAKGRPIVVAGSLYLAGDVLRYKEDLEIRKRGSIMQR